jgi:hypothetical protein
MRVQAARKRVNLIEINFLSLGVDKHVHAGDAAASQGFISIKPGFFRLFVKVRW